MEVDLINDLRGLFSHPFFSAALPAALLSSGAVLLWEWWKGGDERKRAANYAALRIASLLEAYALSCSRLIDENDEYDCWYHQSAKLDIALPKFQSYPDDVDWKALTPALVGKVLSFPNEVMMRNEEIYRHAYEPNAMPDEGKFFSSLVCGLIGLKALGVATEIRDIYNLHDYCVDVGSYAVERLKEYKVGYDEFKEHEKAGLPVQR